MWFKKRSRKTDSPDASAPADVQEDSVSVAKPDAVPKFLLNMQAVGSGNIYDTPNNLQFPKRKRSKNRSRMIH